MGVLILQLLVCGQLILFSLAAKNATDQVLESPLNKTNTSQPYVTAVSLNTTGNYTQNNASTSVPNNSTFNSSNTNVTTSTTTMTPTVNQNITVAPEQSNETVSGSTTQPNVTTAQTNQSRTSAPITTANITSTAITTLNRTTYSSTTGTTVTTSKTSPTTKPTEKTSTTVTGNSTTIRLPGAGLNGSETSLTILFSIVLGMIILMILVYFAHKFRRRKQTRVQYTHRRLQNEDTGEQFTAPDDTLVISGGLYDGPQIYNPTMTVQSEEDYQTDTSGFAYRPTQFRLEFLQEDQRRVPDHDTATFHSFHAIDQEP